MGRVSRLRSQEGRCEATRNGLFCSHRLRLVGRRPGRRSRPCCAPFRRSCGAITTAQVVRDPTRTGVVVACGTDLHPRVCPWVVADRGYASYHFRLQIAGGWGEARHPVQAQRGSGALPGLDLRQPQCRRTAPGAPEGVASGCRALREDRRQPQRHPLPRRRP